MFWVPRIYEEWEGFYCLQMMMYDGWYVLGNLDVPYTVSPAGPHDNSDRNLSQSSSLRSKSSKTEILRISRGRLKDGESFSSTNHLQSSQIDNKRKRNSSRENSLESLLEEEDPTSEDHASRESLGNPHDWERRNIII